MKGKMKIHYFGGEVEEQIVTSNPEKYRDTVLENVKFKDKEVKYMKFNNKLVYSSKKLTEFEKMLIDYEEWVKEQISGARPKLTELSVEQAAALVADFDQKETGLQKAESLLYGYYQAKQGDTLSDIIIGMNMTKEEFDKLQEREMLWFLSESEIELVKKLVK